MGNQEMKLSRLDTQSVGYTYVSYLIPSMVGSFLMAINFVVDGIMIGNRLGAIPFAGVGIAAPVFTMFLALSLWVGTGAATQYSQLMGKKMHKKAQLIFTQAFVFILIITIVVSLVAFLFREPLIYALGANKETYPFASLYINVLIPFGLVYTIKNTLRVFIQNDGSPMLSMIAVIVESLSNIVLNYISLYILNMGVTGAVLSTIIAAFFALIVLSTHFFKSSNNLRFVHVKFEKGLLKESLIIGFPNFITEAGITIFTVSHNVTLRWIAGTEGVAAFTVLNYVHSVMLLMFLGMASAIQPLISYYHGSKNNKRKQETKNLAFWTVIASGMFFFVIGQIFAPYIVTVFGDFSYNIRNLAVTGIRIFFISYLFMGINFVYMTYYQSTANIRLALWITVARQIIVMLVLLLILPQIFGVIGVWLVAPLSEILVLVGVYIYLERHR